VVGLLFYTMSILTDTIEIGFKELQSYAETTARFGDADYPCIQGETQEMADLVIGGIDEQLDGVLIFNKNDFSALPIIGARFIYGNMYLRIESITTDKSDPTFTTAFSKIQDIEGVAPAIGDPSFPCYYIDGGVVDHNCE